eukprot:Clim_evm22s191 gene=Clim_evmTU22s191
MPEAFSMGRMPHANGDGRGFDRLVEGADEEEEDLFMNETMEDMGFANESESGVKGLYDRCLGGQSRNKVFALAAGGIVVVAFIIVIAMVSTGLGSGTDPENFNSSSLVPSMSSSSSNETPTSTGMPTTTPEPSETTPAGEGETVEGILEPGKSVAKGKPWEKSDGRLPQYPIPTEYSIVLNVDMDTLTYRGHMSVTLYNSENDDTEPPMDYLIMHSKDQTITNVTVTAMREEEHAQTKMKIKDFIVYEEHDFLVIILDETMRAGACQVEVDFDAKLRDDMLGFYASTYGEGERLATTQFESTSAREAFPCLDEPSKKAEFEIDIIHPPEYHVLSNSKVDTEKDVAANGNTENDPNLPKKATKFFKTPRMSTYLIAFIVSKFETKGATNTTVDNVEVKVWSQPDQVDQTLWARDVTVKVMDHYSNYYNTPFPLKKQDLVAIPDFNAGAMENWGLITFREYDLLYDEQTSTQKEKRYVAEVVAHELAHQWFGNLVTMAWWNDLWLNEGFAAYLEHVGADVAMPGRAEGLPVLDQFRAMNLDSYNYTHAISGDIQSLEEIEARFDGITYDKGSSLIRMLENAMGTDAFRSGLNVYLEKHSYQNTVADDLWDALDSQLSGGESSFFSSITVNETMNDWIHRPGYPLVNVQYEANGITLTQRKFVRQDGQVDGGREQHDGIWHVPVECDTIGADGTRKSMMRTLFSERTKMYTSDNASGTCFCNVNRSGFYRVSYSDDGWQQLIKTVKEHPTVFHPQELAGFLDDAYQLALFNFGTIAPVLDLLEVLKDNTDLVVLRTAFKIWNDLVDLFPEYPQIETRKANTAYGAHHKLRTEHGDLEGAEEWLYEAQAYAMEQAVLSGDPELIATGGDMYQNLTTNESAVEPYLRTFTYMAGLSSDGQAAYKYVWNVYQNTNVPGVKRRCLRALCSSKAANVLKSVLDEVLKKDSAIRHQDIFFVWQVMGLNSSAQDLLWQFTREHWGSLVDLHSNAEPAMIKSTIGRMNRPVDYDDGEVFCKEHGDETPRIRIACDQALEQARQRMDFSSRVANMVKVWIEAADG